MEMSVFVPFRAEIITFTKNANIGTLMLHVRIHFHPKRQCIDSHLNVSCEDMFSA